MSIVHSLLQVSHRVQLWNHRTFRRCCRSLGQRSPIETKTFAKCWRTDQLFHIFVCQCLFLKQSFSNLWTCSNSKHTNNAMWSKRLLSVYDITKINNHIKLDEKIMSTQTQYFITYMEQQYTDTVAWCTWQKALFQSI